MKNHQMYQNSSRSKINNPRILFIGNFLSGERLSVQPCEFLSAYFEGNGYKVLRTSSKRNKVLRLFDMLVTIVKRRSDYDVAHIDTFSGLAFYWAKLSGILLSYLKKPFIVTLHGGNLPAFSKSNPEMVGRLLCSAAAVTAPSNYLIDEMQSLCEKIEYIPNGINVELYPCVLRERPSPKIIWLRAFHKIYNPQMAVTFVENISREFPDIKLEMYGPDKDGSLEATKTKAVELGVSQFISIKGRIEKSDVPIRLNESDIFINTTNIDNTPVSVIEAMACGLCVVSTNVGGLSYLLEDGIDALLVPPNDAEAMALAVRRILVEPDLASKLSRNARAKVEKFDWSVVLPLWESLFSSLTDDPGRRLD